MNAPVEMEGSGGTLLTAYTVSDIDPLMCNEPSRNPCVGAFFEIGVFIDNAWTPLTKENGPRRLTADNSDWYWESVTTCVARPGNQPRTYRSYFEQSYSEGSVTILRETLSVTRDHVCFPV